MMREDVRVARLIRVSSTVCPHLNSLCSKSRDGLKGLYEGISNSTIKGAIWKIARLENETTVVHRSPMDPLGSTGVNAQKSLTDGTQK